MNTLEPITPPEFEVIKALKGVTSVNRAEKNTLIMSLSGGAAEQSKVLRAILNSGVNVVSYTPQHTAIEDAYLHLVPEGDY
jgi:hypothetical protein